MKIERNVPMPTPKVAPSKKERVPVENMEVGDSLLFAGVTRNSAVAKCMGTAMKAGLPYAFRSAKEGEAVRVWRVR